MIATFGSTAAAQCTGWGENVFLLTPISDEQLEALLDKLDEAELAGLDFEWGRPDDFEPGSIRILTSDSPGTWPFPGEGGKTLPADLNNDDGVTEIAIHPDTFTDDVSPGNAAALVTH